MATNIKRSQSLAVSFERRTMCRLDTRTMASGEPIWPIPMKAIGAQNLLTMPGGVTSAGYLHKRGGIRFQLLKWPLRYVIIHKGCVYYFKTSTSSSSQGAFSLNGYNRVMRAAEETTSSNVFPFKVVHVSKKHRTWYFSAASEEERKKWMLALRKEIDRYHEKKETVTDLSDTGSESDSFYDSVERPVNIKYTQNPSEDSWQDQDEDEDDYLQPDGIDAAPTYPIPPVPTHSDRRSLSYLPPSPSVKKSTSDSKDLDVTGSVQKLVTVQNYGSCEPGTKHPPISVSPAVPEVGEPFALADSHKKFSYISEKEGPGARKDNTCFPNSNMAAKNTTLSLLPPQPPIPWKNPAVLLPSNSIGNCETGVSPFIRELHNTVKAESTTPPPVPKNKPVTGVSTPKQSANAPVLPVKPNKSPNAGSSTPPVPPNKPKFIGAGDQSQEVSTSRDEKKQFPLKPPPIQPLSPIVRSPPDGQSFRIPIEPPIMPVRPLVDDRSDSDEDYEKVPLPPTVFVETTESNEVEWMFKAASSGGTPVNGLFCIRNSSKSGKVLVVWDKKTERVRNYRIFEKDNKVYLEPDLSFADIGGLVEHYYENTLPSHETLLLRHAYGCPGSSR
ncbi:SH3 domain-binding protein 2 [Spea bombifrons]|uniref:SH3 domain-binding protein 2 n=1 Tax=Spea bombifrons TaxID=233779 RepID=UPI0023494897|nr:SH3 domain-binding protein 2 [Spea bombifrons]